MPQSFADKEPSYFCHSYGVADFASYSQIFASVKDEIAVGEASHAYLTSPESPILIKEFNPDSKIIIILRDPVERAYSLYRWMLSAGYEYLFPFEKALEKECSRNTDLFLNNNPQYFYNYLYFRSGQYSEQIQRYTSIFPKKNIRIYLFEDLKHDPQKLMRDIYAFLGVECNFRPTIVTYNKSGNIPFSSLLNHFTICSLPTTLNKLRIPRRHKIINSIKDVNLKLGYLRNCKFKSSTKRELRRRYIEDIKETEEITGLNLGKWLVIN